MDNVVQEARDIVDRDLDKQLTFIEVWWVGKYGSEAQRATLKDRKLRYADNLIGTGLPDDNFKSYDSSQLRYPKGHKLGGQWRPVDSREYVQGSAIDVEEHQSELEEADKSNRTSYDSTDPDFILDYILEEQGFKGLPEIVHPDDVAELVAEGDTEIFRGLSNYGEPGKFVEQYHNGEMFIGKGIYGNGVYTTTDEEQALEAYAGDNPARVISMLLRSDAKVVTPKELDNISRSLFSEYRAAKDDVFKRAFEAFQTGGNDLAAEVMAEQEVLDERFGPLRAITSDEGRLAAFLGYDAIRVDRGDERTYFILLNRTATRAIDRR